VAQAQPRESAPDHRQQREKVPAYIATTIGFAIFVRIQPPTVIRIGPNGDASVFGKDARGAVTDLATGGTDEFLDEAFVKRFLTSYLNYSSADVDDHWASSLNMMTRFRRILGDPIYGEILWRVAHARQANAIPNTQLQANVAETMERASRGVSKTHSLAEQIGETSFIAIVDKLRIESMTTIPRLEMLKTLVAELERKAARTAA
jgi:hypothetical protein